MDENIKLEWIENTKKKRKKKEVFNLNIQIDTICPYQDCTQRF